MRAALAFRRTAGLVESTKQGVWVYYRLREDLSPVSRGLLEALLGTALAGAGA